MKVSCLQITAAIVTVTAVEADGGLRANADERRLVVSKRGHPIPAHCFNC